MRKILTTLAALALVATAGIAPASAITDGTEDGDGHPYVGLMVAHGWEYNPVTEQEEYGPLWRCSGTLIAPTVFLTAGHCTEEPADHVEIWFDADVQSLYHPPTAEDQDDWYYENGYPYDGYASGTPHTPDGFQSAAFFLKDVGVVTLDEALTDDQLKELGISEFGELPGVGALNQFAKRGKKGATFTSVGYGLQKSFPDAAGWKDSAAKVRMVAHPKLNQINAPGFTGDFSMLLSNNARTGGTCFGDSGGPNFIGDSNVVAGVTSFGLNPTCAGTGGVFRMDQQWVLDWVKGFMED